MRRTFWTLTALSLLGAAVMQAQERDVRVGVLGLFHSKQIVVSPIAGKLLQCRAGGEPWSIGDPMRVELEGAKARIAGTDNVFDSAIFCDNGESGATEFVASIPGKITRRYLGKLEIRPDSREMLVVVVMAIENAVASVVAAESPPHAPMEALKAQAVATRSFFLAGKGRHHSFDFCDTTHCQFLRAPPGPATAAFQAAAATRGLVLAYKDEVFAAMYSASCGGQTHTLTELGIPVHGYPYFAVTCNYCRRHPEKWVRQLKTEDAAALAPTESARLNLARKLGWKSVPGNSYSSRTENGSVVLEGVGVGHGIGLCQRGGADMARHGASFLEILQHYYPNAEVRHY
ncbi:MAG TPA: SpoIID/LytB domain-containing protein [Candidatus Binatia bacterium]|nr:SpoIID/LytB domain-containing protein [Candidatus Binatia bacterium]